MEAYHKIQTLYSRNPDTGLVNVNMYSTPEFKYLEDNLWTFTEKIDGTNVRVAFDGENISFGGKTDRAEHPKALIEKLHDIFIPKIGIFKEKFHGPVCLYGEGFGGRIQKAGPKYSKDIDFILFDVRIGNWWLERDNVNNIADFLGIKSVPIVGNGNLRAMTRFVSVGMVSSFGNFLSEGLVARPSTELIARNGRRIITKLKHTDFGYYSE